MAGEAEPDEAWHTRRVVPSMSRAVTMAGVRGRFCLWKGKRSARRPDCSVLSAMSEMKDDGSRRVFAQALSPWGSKRLIGPRFSRILEFFEI